MLDVDKDGNFFLNRDSESFRHILAYLRFKNEGIKVALALPSQPDELAKLAAECGALRINEFERLALRMLSNYKHLEASHVVKTYTNYVFNEFTNR